MYFIRFSDIDWCGDKTDMISTIRHFFKFLGALASHCSKKQSIASLYSCDAKYVVGVAAACQAN